MNLKSKPVANKMFDLKEKLKIKSLTSRDRAQVFLDQWTSVENFCDKNCECQAPDFGDYFAITNLSKSPFLTAHQTSTPWNQTLFLWSRPVRKQSPFKIGKSEGKRIKNHLKSTRPSWSKVD